MKTPRAIAAMSGPFVPVASGIGAALLLGAAGFGLGCVYAGVAAPLRAPAAVSAPAPVAMPAVAIPGAVTEVPSAPQSAPQSAQISLAVAAAATATGSRNPAMALPVTNGWVSSRFGPREDPFTGEPAVHRGLDFAGHDNSTIHAAASGLVTWSGQLKGYGNLIEIDHGQGWVTRYGHNASNLVARGDYVKPGQPIALMGSTGRATGTHLHFEVLYQGRHQNPARFVPRET